MNYLAYLLSILLSTRVQQQPKQEWIIKTFVNLDFEKVESSYTIHDLAQDKLNDLVTTGYWSHTNSNGCDFECRAKPYLKNYDWIGENLYRGPCRTELAYKLWNKSESHRANLEHYFNEEVLLQGKYKQDMCYYVLIRGIKK